MLANTVSYDVILLAGVVNPMIFLQVFTGVLFGCACGCSLWRTWRAEHGEKMVIPMDDRRELYMFNPIWLIVLVAFYFWDCRISIVRGALASFGSDAVRMTLALLIKMLMFVSVYYAVMLLAISYCRKKLNARSCAALWVSPFTVCWFLEWGETNLYLMYEATPGASRLNLRIPYGAPVKILIGIWLAGFAVIFIWQLISNAIFRRKLVRHSRVVEDAGMLAIWKEEKDRVDYYVDMELWICDCIKTPLSMGIIRWNKATFLPDQEFSEQDLHLIFNHELHHVQRNDMMAKCFLLFCKAFLWFNPLMWFAVKRAEEDLELSCDEIVLEGRPDEEKTHYARLLLSTAGEARGFSTCLSASAKTLRYRLRATLQKPSNRLGVPLVIAVCIACCLVMTCFQVELY